MGVAAWLRMAAASRAAHFTPDGARTAARPVDEADEIDQLRRAVGNCMHASSASQDPALHACAVIGGAGEAASTVQVVPSPVV